MGNTSLTTPMIVALCVVAVIVIIVIAYFISKSLKKKESQCPIDLDALIQALGGKDNIVKCESTPSTVKATLKVQTGVALNDIKALGASGVVQGADTITMIFGHASKVICDALEKELG
jgi:PTS system D-glucosamine-specific IIC component